MTVVFTPNMPTIAVTADASPPLGVALCPALVANTQVRIYNASEVDVTYAFGASAADAQANAVLATAGNPRDSVTLPAGTGEITGIRGRFVSASSSAPAVVYFTPGNGA
jgi:hypothetical protein